MSVMKAVKHTRYGPPDVLVPGTLETPVPRAGQVLVRIHAATVTPGDCEARACRFPWWIRLPMRIYFGVLRPRRPLLGMEYSGVVAAVGEGVTRFAEGDAVFASTGLPFGTYAEYRCQSAASAIVAKPDAVSHAEAATLGMCGQNALHYFRNGRVRAGDHVLVNGAAGCFGTYIVQLAKQAGARVTAVDHGDKLAILPELGADVVIDYTREDFTASSGKYDVILEIAGKAPYSRCLRALRPGGRLVLANPTFSQMLRTPFTSRFTDKTVSFIFAADRAEDLAQMASLAAAGSLRTVIDRRYSLDEVAEAHRHVESGTKVGHVVIDVRQPDPPAPR